MKIDNILQSIGSTPHVRIHRLFGAGTNVWVKSERSNPGGSIKDRIALAMVEDAERSGALQPGGTIIEPTSGNTGIGLALVAAVKGYRLILVMPESMSIERRRLMLAYGAQFDLTPREKGMKGAIARAQELAAQTPGAWVPQQFENPANIDVHVRTTAQEILADFPEGIDALITGVGTGGHITGVARVLKPKFPQLKVFAVEPVASPVISGGQPAPHPIQGIGAGFVPKNLDTSLLDGVIQVDAEPAREYARRAAREEGLLVGISSGATLAAIAQKLPELPQERARAGLQLRHGRALPVGRGLPALVSTSLRRCAPSPFSRRAAHGGKVTPVAGPSPFHGVCWCGLLRGLLMGEAVRVHRPRKRSARSPTARPGGGRNNRFQPCAAAGSPSAMAAVPSYRWHPWLPTQNPPLPSRSRC